jgi:hypothetical protein
MCQYQVPDIRRNQKPVPPILAIKNGGDTLVYHPHFLDLHYLRIFRDGIEVGGKFFGNELA